MIIRTLSSKHVLRVLSELGNDLLKNFWLFISNRVWQRLAKQEWQRMTKNDKELQRMANLSFQCWQGKNQKVHLISPWIHIIKTKWPLCTVKIKFVSVTYVQVFVSVSPIDIKVTRLAIVCPCPFRIMILCYSTRPKSGWKLGYV